MGSLGRGQYFGVGNPQMKQQWHFMHDDLEKLEQTLSEEQRKLLEKYSATLDHYFVTVSEQAFCDGFCMGTKLAAEALVGVEKMI